MGLSRVSFFDLRYDHQHRSPVLFLKDMDKEKYLPVWIGESEASSIELAAISKRPPPRPLTHDLFSTVLRELNVHLDKVVIDRVESRTYFATMYLEHDGRILKIDCRPSDAIAMALRSNTRIYVDEELMFGIKFVELSEAELAEGIGEEEEGEPARRSSEFESDDAGFREFLKRISPSDFKEN